MSELPALWRDAASPQVHKAARARERLELEVHAHQLHSLYRREVERIDNEVLEEVVTESLKAELDFYDEAMQRANGSAAKAALIADKLNLLRKTNSARIARTFGGW